MSDFQKIEQHFNNIIENYSKTNQKQAIEFIKIFRGFFSELVKTNAFIGKEKDLFKIINEHLSKPFCHHLQNLMKNLMILSLKTQKK